jgi:hypothetical protein
MVTSRRAHRGVRRRAGHRERTVYLTDIRHREAVYRVVGRHLRDVYPVFTGLIVTALARPVASRVTVVAVRA